MPHPVRIHPMQWTGYLRPALVAMLAIGVITGCGGNTPPPAASPAPPQSTILRSGDVTIHASAVPTSALGAAVASQYGIQRGDDTVLLLVALRQGPEAQEISLPATVRVTVTDLFGQKRDVPMRELRSGDLLDYIGTFDVSAPDTLRFDLRIVREGGQVSTMQFTREFHPN